MKPFYIALAALVLSGPCIAQGAVPRLIDGECGEGSHTSEGPVGTDLTGRHVRFFCDSLVMSEMGDGKLLMQFAEKKAMHGSILAFGGRMDTPATMNVERVYFEPGNPTQVDDGICKFFFDGRQKVTSVMCAAKVDESGRRTVQVVVFKAKHAF